jgi:hypothetical protein
VQDDVDEALRLIEASKESLYQDQGSFGRDMSPSSRIYNMVRALAESGQCRPDDADEDEEEGGMELSMRKVEERVIAKGFTRDQWQTAVMEYTNLDVSFLSLSLLLKHLLIILKNRSGKLQATAQDSFSLSQKRRTWLEMRSMRWIRSAFISSPVMHGYVIFGAFRLFFLLV